MKPFSLMSSGDHHFVEGARFAECKRIHAWMVEEARRDPPDVFISTGDMCDTESTPAVREAVADFLTSMATVCPVIVAKGNHDRPRDAALMQRLRSTYPITVVESCGIVRVGPAAIAVVAWPNRASVAAMLGPRADAEQLDALTGEALQRVLAGLGDELAAHEGPRILAGHFAIDGAMTSSGQPLIGGGMRVGLADLALARADLNLAGHIHLPQHWAHAGVETVMVGSPYRTAFGEVEEKSIVRATWERGAFRGWSRAPTPCTGMLLFTGTWGAETGLVVDDAGATVTGAEVRLRVSVSSDQRAQAKVAAASLRDAWLAAGAISVKVEEEVRPTTRARAPEIAKAVTLEEQLREFWKVRGIEVDDARRARLLAKLEEF